MVWMQPLMRFFGCGIGFGIGVFGYLGYFGFFGFDDRKPVPQNPRRKMNPWDFVNRKQTHLKRIQVLEITDNGSHWETEYENGEVYREWYYGRTEQRMMREMDQIGRYIQTFGIKKESPTGPNDEAIAGELNGEPNTRVHYRLETD